MGLWFRFELGGLKWEAVKPSSGNVGVRVLYKHTKPSSKYTLSLRTRAPSSPCWLQSAVKTDRV